MDFTGAPLTQLPNGSIRVTGSRVTLDVLMNLIKQGFTAEKINDCFPSVSRGPDLQHHGVVSKSQSRG